MGTKPLSMRAYNKSAVTVAPPKMPHALPDFLCPLSEMWFIIVAATRTAHHFLPKKGPTVAQVVLQVFQSVKLRGLLFSLH